MWCINFASTVNNMNDSLPKSRWDCFDYGSWYWCDDWCPQWQRWDCEIWLENTKEEKFNVFLDTEEFYRIKEKYMKRIQWS